jgi:hypothetical protein
VRGGLNIRGIIPAGRPPGGSPVRFLASRSFLPWARDVPPGNANGGGGSPDMYLVFPPCHL